MGELLTVWDETGKIQNLAKDAPSEIFIIIITTIDTLFRYPERKIEVDGHIIQIKPVNYVDRLGLQGEFADVYANGTDNVSQKAFNLLLGHTAEIAFNNPDTALKEYPYDVQLKILTNIMSEYLGLSDNQKKSDGV